MGKEAAFLNDVTDVAAQADGVPSGGNHAVNDDLASRWHEHAVDQSKESCLSGTATAEKNERSEEHTSELQSRLHLVCRLLLEKKKKQKKQKEKANHD